MNLAAAGERPVRHLSSIPSSMSDRSSPEAFRWPPVPEGGGVVVVPRLGGRPSSPVPTDREASWRDLLLDIERTWLGLERPGLADMVREAGWRRDAAASYCGRCGRTAGGEETLDPGDASTADAGCGECRGRAMAWDRVIRLGEHEGLLRTAVLETKFARARGMGRALGHELGAAIAEAMGRVVRGRTSGWREVVVVPMPASRWRRFVRGIDHASVLAEGVAGELGVRRESWLARSHRPAQATLSEASRRRNVAGTMRLSRRGMAKLAAERGGRLVLVIDDVMTTGSTMREACRRLASAGGPEPEIWACVATVAGEGAV